VNRIPPKPNQSGQAPDRGQPVSGSAGELRAIGHYRILRAIGTGGMSEVYLAHDAKLLRQVAIKVLAERLVGNHTFVNRFQHEGRLSKELSHPNIVKGFACGRDSGSGRLYIAMEYVDGPTAQERLDREGRLPISDAVRIVVDIARAIEYLHHQRYVHRDIKPGNILLAPDGSAKLADLGVAKFLESDVGLTTLDQSIGTPYYMPWEQSVNSGLVDARSDIFALGATLYHLATGQVPFPGDDEASIAHCKEIGVFKPVCEHDPQLPAVLETILERMLARDPRRRFTSALEVVEVLTASGLADENGSPPADLPLFVPQPLAPTRADLKVQGDVDTPLEPGEEIVWQVKFQRQDGSWRKFRGKTREITRLFEQGALPDTLFATREPSLVFRRLRAYPEFRKLVRKASQALPEKAKNNRLRRSPKELSPSGGLWHDYLRKICFTGAVALLACCSGAAIVRLLAG
jgi:eukaryotic-like serine/threonine-protein kinase